jgi:hypothetical protein
LQMSLWGEPYCAQNGTVFSIFIIKRSLFLTSTNHNFHTWSLIKIKSHERIGPHNYDILCLIFKSLMGDAYAEKRSGSTRICFQQESTNAECFIWLHSYLAKHNYCNPKKPEWQRRLGNQGTIRFVCRLKTWSFKSFNWIHEEFYPYPPVIPLTPNPLMG